jgi:alkanesulfonate monooxygenase SsuD/methylene tetrahydromethanopterin reductase-like flavin-dependent oxidoreductase (luciferase family)
LITTVVVPQLHDPVLLAKSLATGDMLSGGRLTVGLGVGGRVEDYRAVGADPSAQTMVEMANRVETMKKVWAGQKITDSVLPVGPAPVQPSGPRLLVGTIGPKTLRSAAGWADGLAGITFDLDAAEQDKLFEVGRTAWAQASKSPPHLATSFWFALGDPADARAQIHRHLRHYLNWLPVEVVNVMASTVGFAGTEDQLARVLRGFAAVGTCEVHLIPTSSDLDQLGRAADVARDFPTSEMATP